MLETRSTLVGITMHNGNTRGRSHGGPFDKPAPAKVELAHVSWNYTTYLNIVFLALAALLIWRYFRRGGGWAMLKMMNKPMDGDHDQHHHHRHGEHVHA